MANYVKRKRLLLAVFLRNKSNPLLIYFVNHIYGSLNQYNPVSLAYQFKCQLFSLHPFAIANSVFVLNEIKTQIAKQRKKRKKEGGGI